MGNKIAKKEKKNKKKYQHLDDEENEENSPNNEKEDKNNSDDESVNKTSEGFVDSEDEEELDLEVVRESKLRNVLKDQPRSLDDYKGMFRVHIIYFSLSFTAQLQNLSC